MHRPLATLIVLATTGSTPSAFAYDEALSFERTIAGNYEAVISGTTNGCEDQSNTRFDPPTSISASGNAIAIVSPFTALGGCGVAPERQPYRTIANLGSLTDGEYQVNWSIKQDDFVVRSLTATFRADAVSGLGTAPALNAFTNALLMFLMIALAAWKFRSPWWLWPDVRSNQLR
jgi:hypothetical protein